MPIMIPPTFLDVPAIVRAAAHSSASPAQIQHPLAARPPTVIRPNDASGQQPTTVAPVPVVPPAAGGASHPVDGALQSSGEHHGN
jgi:hypothetical protein